MIRYKQLFYILDKPLLLSFYSFETYIGLLQFSLSLVMAEYGCGYRHFVCSETFLIFFFFFSEILGQNVFSTFPGLFTHTLNVYKVLWKVLGTFFKSTKHFFKKCLALFDWAFLSTFEHLTYEFLRKLSTFYQQNF